MGDQLRLSAATPTSTQEDAKVAAAQEIKEMQQRIEVLQQNLQQLRDAVQHQAEPAQNAQTGQGARPAMSGMARVQQVANDNVLWVVLGASAVLALLMALMLRRAGARESEAGSSSHGNEAVASAFDQKLQSIDLNLDSSAPDLKTSVPAERKV
ncbi:MAG: hypothetical protein ACKO0Z_14410 [Betaproteobacteria bacterium]